MTDSSSRQRPDETGDHHQSASTGLPDTLARTNGISYFVIPATDTQISAEFYAAVFGWHIDEGRPSHRGFQDGTGHVAGAFVTGETPGGAKGLLPYVYVRDVDATVARIVERGGEITEQPRPEGQLRVARFRDPAGNVLGVWRHIG